MTKKIIIVFTGDGKGKTSAALGTAMRMIADGGRVFWLAFMKDPDRYDYAETELAAKLPGFEVYLGGGGFTWEAGEEEIRKHVQSSWVLAKEKLFSGQYSLVVLDELLYCLNYHFISEAEVLGILKQYMVIRDQAGGNSQIPDLVLTGRYDGTEVLKMADLVTEMRCVVHPFDTQGITGRKGIDW